MEMRLAMDCAKQESKRGRSAEALDWLNRSVEAGFAEAEWMAYDKDLIPLKGPAFDALVTAARQNGKSPAAR